MPALTKKLLLFLQQDPEPNELAKYLTLVDMVHPLPRAATISAINDDGSIYEIARFGLSGKDPFLDRNPIWEKLQPFEEVRANRIAVLNPKDVFEQISSKGIKIEMDSWLRSVVVVPIVKKEIPIGALGLFFDEELNEVPKLEIDYESLQALFVLAFRTPQFAYAIAKYSAGELPELTDQELLFINLIARGYSNKQIAGRTQLALPTVKAKVSKLLKEFDAKNRKELVEIAKEKNIPAPRV
jgi:DNA-binding CsgD family transcriptional regulator